MPDENNYSIPSLRKRDWIILAAFIVALAVALGVYSEWIGPKLGLHRIETNIKSNLPLRVDPNTTLVDVKYEKAHSTYWYVVDDADHFDPQEKARQVQIGVCSNAENSKAIKNEGLSYEHHYRTKQGLTVADFKITTCPEN
jgi:flagellar basal body-associated protein FliL